ncbi:MAG TPA: class I SAM-dependent methyltransferase [Planctomycetota bacterium]|nr:class I SAM-dependent methyltransferase [Planctomycetota bacterium]
MQPDPDVYRLRREWEERARSPYRDFFVASHRGWRDADAWRRQAEVDVGHLLTRAHGERQGSLGGTPLHDLDVLEIGCGVGRLAAVLAPRVRSYVGVDLSPTMVARANESAAPNCRFLVNDGVSMPSEIRERRFHLVFGLAVFIHCPKSVCAALTAEARRMITPDGQFRGHFLCDPTDLEGMIAAEAPATHDPVVEFEGHVERDALRFLEDTAYTGHLFRAPELRDMATAAGFGDVGVWRFDPIQMYCVARA